MSFVKHKRAAAEAALEYIENGMKVGIGTGSTADFFTKALGEKVANGLDIIGVPTSAATQALCEELNIPLADLNDEPVLDVTVDGADELDGNLSLIKGGGGALVREKIVATCSKKMIVIADQSKKVETLGQFPLPVELIPFGARATSLLVSTVAHWAGCEGPIRLRKLDEENPFVTDNGNLIIDCHFDTIPDVRKLQAGLNEIAGVVDHGLFVGIAKIALIGGDSGVEKIEV